MFWAFEKTTPANATIMEIDNSTFARRLLKEFQKVDPMQLCCSNLLRLSMADTISQLAQEMFKTEINSCLKFFLIVLKWKSRKIISTSEYPAVFVLMSLGAMSDSDIDTSVSGKRRSNIIKMRSVTKIILEASWGYPTHRIFAWPMSVAETLESLI
jgi:hypothetical protein